MGLEGVLKTEKDVEMIKWTLIMQECGLSINLQQLNMKVTNTQTRPISFRNEIPNNSWWYWFKGGSSIDI